MQKKSNPSSGAEKVETIQKRVEKERKNAQKRAELAKKQLVRKEEKEARKARKTERKTARAKTQSARKKSRHQHARQKGVGGWIAVVVALSFSTLTLGAIVAVGAKNTMQTTNQTAFMHEGTLYELASVVDDADETLDKARLCTSKSMQSEVLTELLVQSRLAEGCLERLPMACNECENLSTFWNATAKFAEESLAKLANGQTLDGAFFGHLQTLYERHHALRKSLDETVAKMTDKDVLDFLKKGEKSDFSKTLKGLEEGVEPPNYQKPIEAPKPRETQNTQETGEGKRKERTLADAERLCRRYFDGYKIATVTFVGETANKSLPTYNFSLTDDKGREFRVSLDKQSGALALFDFYENCTERNMESKDCERVADTFLKKLGYENVVAVYEKEKGAIADFVFVTRMDDVTYYPEEIKVKVCMQKGVVVGIDATKFLKNARGRERFTATISLETAQKVLPYGATVLSAQKAVVPVGNKTRHAFEFFLAFQGERYLLYVDATTGEQTYIVNVKNLLV